VGFLEEAQDRLSNYASLFDEAIEHYKIVAENLDLLAKLFPFKGPNSYGLKVDNKDQQAAAIDYLTEARDAEESGLKSLKSLQTKL